MSRIVGKCGKCGERVVDQEVSAVDWQIVDGVERATTFMICNWPCGCVSPSDETDGRSALAVSLAPVEADRPGGQHGPTADYGDN